MVKSFSLVLLYMLMVGPCSSQRKVNLATLVLDEKIEQLVKFGDRNFIGINTVEVPVAIVLECKKSTAFTFNEVKLDGVNIVFQIQSDITKKDTSLHDGMGHLRISSFKTKEELTQELSKLNADSVIYGYRIELNTPELKAQLLKELIKLYGKGIKNPNTDNGLYWNLPKENKYIFFAPDYDRLIVLNNKKLSKTCYWDNVNGLIDFGGCDREKYIEELRN
ncbi:hypothetical protein, partial [Solitalea canadensis]|uniref:Uncharacterized protein n=1 Tax=Solitalea canadensis (strain ATCC 29591 / DSM 3403 / JCM 21819 / LMG 8368 / NBRC 15130 / NCIMB 12057 / USAM 9D) TaxID=929556 RepID=H8KT67_SOLCM